MTDPPPTLQLYSAIRSFLRDGDGDRSERSIRCQLLFRPVDDSSYTVWVRSAIREYLSAQLGRAIGRSLPPTDDYWILNIREVERLLAVVPSRVLA